MVAGAVAGDDLNSVAATVARALECPVAIAIPAHGPPVVSPVGSLGEQTTAEIAAHAHAVCEGRDAAVPAAVAAAVPVRIGEQVVGIVVATAGHASAERRAWLEAAAAAASVTALIREAPGPDSDEILIAELTAGAPEDTAGLVTRARRLGLDLSLGAVALSARGEATGATVATGSTVATGARDVLMAEPRPGRVVAIAAASTADDAGSIGDLAASLRDRGLSVAVSAPRRDPALLHEAIREAELLAELGAGDGVQPNGQDETYRLLIGVLLRDRTELEQLRDSTVTSLREYDKRHDTDLLPTLCAFLAYDGSTTETAEAMALHRHTVGYRLSRIQEVSGLSPYESDGRERLSLGIKAQQILVAASRLDADWPAR
jgi:hypothetical protein